MAERIDNIGFNNYKLIQDVDGFCYGVDAVLLADFALCSEEENVLDLCCGNGAVSFILNAKYNPRAISGLDIQRSQIEIASRNSRLNSLEHKISFICADALDISKHYGAASFDVVVCNPPYFEKSGGMASAKDCKSLARHESSAGIRDFIKAAGYVLKPFGRMYLIHRPSRLVDIMYEARSLKLEPKLMQFVCPYPNQAPNMVMLQLVKGGGKELKILPDITVRNESGEWSDKINEIYGR